MRTLPKSPPGLDLGAARLRAVVPVHHGIDDGLPDDVRLDLPLVLPPGPDDAADDAQVPLDRVDRVGDHVRDGPGDRRAVKEPDAARARAVPFCVREDGRGDH